MKITFGGFFRITPATIMRCGPTFRLARTHPTHARSSGLETSLRSRSLADYTIDTHESEFSEATGNRRRVGVAGLRLWLSSVWLRLRLSGVRLRLFGVQLRLSGVRLRACLLWVRAATL